MSHLNVSYQWCYEQTSDTGVSANFLPTSSSNFTFQATDYSPNTTDTLFVEDAVVSSSGQTNAIIEFPITGLYSINWSVRFNVIAFENSVFLGAFNCYGDSDNNIADKRIATCDSTVYSPQLSYTGYFQAGDQVALRAFSTTENFLSTYNSGLVVSFFG